MDTHKILEKGLQSNEPHVLAAAMILAGLVDLSGSCREVARSIVRLGNNNAATEVGAIEGLGMALSENLSSIAHAIGCLTDSANVNNDHSNEAT